MSSRRIAMQEIDARQRRVDRTTLASIFRLGVATVALSCVAAGCQSHSGPSTPRVDLRRVRPAPTQVTRRNRSMCVRCSRRRTFRRY